MADGYRCPDCGDILVGYAEHCDETVINIVAEDPVNGIPEGGYPNCPSCPPPAIMEPVHVAWTPRDVIAQHGRRQRIAEVPRPEPIRAKHDWRSPIQ